jgi:hypothetical protein
MCEPMHSIIQFVDPDDNDGSNFPSDDNNTGASAQSSRQSFVGKVGKFFKKIGKFLHISMMGKGHSEVLNTCSGSGTSRHIDMSVHSFIIPPHLKWETDWVYRKMNPDGICIDHSEFEKIASAAEKSAKEYTESVCIGGLTQFRKYFETSIELTEKRYVAEYIEMFLNLLNTDGRTAFSNKFNRIFRHVGSFSEMVRKISAMPKRSSIADFCLGLFRKREFLIHAWADDQKLWLPSKKIVTELPQQNLPSNW